MDWTKSRSKRNSVGFLFPYYLFFCRYDKSLAIANCKKKLLHNLDVNGIIPETPDMEFSDATAASTNDDAQTNESENRPKRNSSEELCSQSEKKPKPDAHHSPDLFTDCTDDETKSSIQNGGQTAHSEVEKTNDQPDAIINKIIPSTEIPEDDLLSQENPLPSSGRHSFSAISSERFGGIDCQALIEALASRPHETPQAQQQQNEPENDVLISLKNLSADELIEKNAAAQEEVSRSMALTKESS